MFEEIISAVIGFLPAYIAVGLFLSWIIWARFFNYGKFKFNGEIEGVFIILKIFFILFIGVGSILFISGLILASLLKTNPSAAADNLTNWPNKILNIFLILTFLLVISVSKRQEINKTETKKLCAKLSFAAFYIPFFILGLTLAAYLSNYRMLAPLFWWCGIFSLVVFLYITWITAKLLSVPATKMINKYVTKYGVLLFSTIFIVIGLISFLLFYLIIFPKITTMQEVNQSYIAFNDYDIYLQKEITYVVGNLGMDTPLSNWIVLHSDFNFTNIKSKYYLEDLSKIIINYRHNQSESIKVSSLLPPYKQDLLVEYNEKMGNLVIKTNVPLFRKDKVDEISMLSFVRITDYPSLIKTICEKTDYTDSFFLNCNISNSLNHPLWLYQFHTYSPLNTNYNSSCNLGGFKFNLVHDGKNVYASKDNVCSSNSCDNNVEKYNDPYLRLTIAGQNLYLDTGKPLNFSNMNLNIFFKC